MDSGFADCMSQLANIGTRFHPDVLFNPDLPKTSIENSKVLIDHIEKAKHHAANTGRSKEDIYVDTSSSARGMDSVYIYIYIVLAPSRGHWPWTIYIYIYIILAPSPGT